MNNDKRTKAFNLLKLFYQSSTLREKGTVLAAVLGFGLVFTLLGSLALLKSNKSQVGSSQTVASEQNISITQGGVSDMLAQLTTPETRGLLVRSFDPSDAFGEGDGGIDEWTDTSIDLTLSNGINACSADEASDSLDTITIDAVTGNATINDVPVGIGDASGTYKLVAYRYDSANDKGKMMIDGKLNKQSDSQSRIVVEFPVKEQPGSSGGSGPAIWANEINIQQSDAITGSVICTDPALCSIECGTTGESSEADWSELKEAIGGSSGNAIIQSTEVGKTTSIQVGGSPIPPIPAVPASCTSKINSLGDVSSNVVLPRIGDQYCSVDLNDPPDGIDETVYYYTLTEIDKSAILMTDMADVDLDLVLEKLEYRLYLDGSIDQQGNDDIRLVDSTKTPSPAQIILYGGDPDGSDPDSGVTEWELGGNACNMVFIHAPSLDVGIEGGGNGCSDIGVDDAVADANEIFGAGTYTTSDLLDPQGTNFYGGVWAKSYNKIGNPSNSAEFHEQPGLMAKLNLMGQGFSGFDTINVTYSERERKGM